MQLQRILLITLVLMIVSLVASWFLLGRLWILPRAVAVAQLEKLLPKLEQTQITAYRNQDWCKNIAYSNGNFSETTHPTTCNLFEGEAKPFDETSRAAFNDLRQTLLFTGINISFLNVYVEEGKIRMADFSLGCWFCNRTRYVYEPNYVLQEDIGGEMWFDAISKNWYIVKEDWN
jgi:hypothetical protein